MGINFNSMAGADSTTSADPIYTYNVALDPGETITLTGDFSNDFAGADGPGDNGDGQYAVVSGTPSFGTLSLSSTDGAFSYSFTAGDVAANGGAQTLTIVVRGTDFNGDEDQATIVINLTCFMAGSLIATPAGDVAVETLGIGDLVRTADGRDVAIKWIGRQTVMPMFNMAARNKIVEIKAGALGGDQPHTDLHLTADHGMVLDGLVVNAGALVNDDTIRFTPRDALEQRFTVYHIETEDHDVILANGAPSETFIDYAGRRMFDNYAEYEALYGADNSITELSLPRISSARMLPQGLRAKLGMEDETDDLFDLAI